ncbi:hypothetical protein HK099_000830 [Clydaea vesicula]|uniref:Reelin domain-containing protein n=1 Tax=Clydaea vesicula TaxID=447962 RepID=A0AAD5XSN0_9FUNG|nr:hypothetical protein HK099_000830 [Clydaea vesicula]
MVLCPSGWNYLLENASEVSTNDMIDTPKTLLAHKITSLLDIIMNDSEAFVRRSALLSLISLIENQDFLISEKKSNQIFLPEDSDLWRKRMYLQKILISLVLLKMMTSKPGAAPLCDTFEAGKKISASPMGENSKPLNDIFKFLADKTTYKPGEKINFKLSGDAEFVGFLMYVTGSKANTEARVGKFETNEEFQNNEAACSSQKLDDKDSVITHKQGKKYAPDSNFNFIAPSADVGDLTLHAIIMQKNGDKFGWGVFENAALIKSEGGNEAEPAPQVNAEENQSPVQGNQGEVPIKGVEVVNESECKPATITEPAQTITQPAVTVTNYVTAVPLTKIQKCKPKNWGVIPTNGAEIINKGLNIPAVGAVNGGYGSGEESTDADAGEKGSKAAGEKGSGDEESKPAEKLETIEEEEKKAETTQETKKEEHNHSH